MDRNDKKFLDANDWDQTQIGFNFDENEVVGGFSTTARKNEDYQLLRCDGLIEASENRNITSQLTWLEEDKSIIEKKYNPLEFSLKQEKKDIKELTAFRTIKQMILGQSYTLEPFKSRESKSELLKIAVSSHDGNAILAVVLFLKSTLKKSIFHREIRMHPDAVRVYLSFLEEDHEMDELANMFLLLDNSEEAAMTKYKSALSLHHPDRKLKNINNCLSTHFQGGVVDDFLCASVLEHKQLLRDQIALDEYHAAASSSEVEAFNYYRQLTNEIKLVDTSVMCSLIFQALFYFNASEAAFISPGYTKATYNLSRKQYTWGAVRAFIVSKKWAEMDALFISKNWLGNEKVKSCISFPQIIRVLSKMQATHELISKYVGFIENQELKLLLAKKYKCHSVVIEILKTNRDRLGLLQYKSILPPHSVDFCSAADILNNKTVKWRN